MPRRAYPFPTWRISGRHRVGRLVLGVLLSILVWSALQIAWIVAIGPVLSLLRWRA